MPRYVVLLEALGPDGLAVAGGKAVNLAAAIRSGLPVPDGFVVTTAAYVAAARAADIAAELDALSDRDLPAERRASLAQAVRGKLLAADVPGGVVDDLRAAYTSLAVDPSGGVAVRSSATAEDLPDASFAGQHDTFLNVRGPEAVTDAVRRCWASLWTDRAVAYRVTNGIDPRSVRLAVVVQRMVADVSAAGVLFTADPVTGHRGRTVIDASFGLGEAIVSGAVVPDHFVLATATGRLLERRTGSKRVAVAPAAGGGTRRVERHAAGDVPSLTDAQLRRLVDLGRRVHAQFGGPQDVEFAVDAADRLWLLQARPVTTLFPLPEDAPDPDVDLRVYFSANVAQGVLGPFTPMGIQALRLIGGGAAAVAGYPARDPLAGPAALRVAGMRLFFDITPALRNRLGRRVLLGATQHMEARTHALLRGLMYDERLSPRGPGTPRSVLRVAGVLARTRMPLRVVRVLAAPAAARERAALAAGRILALGEVPSAAEAAARLAAFQRMASGAARFVLRDISPVLAAGFLANGVSGRLLRGLASADERRIVTRGLPHNPTTAMDLELWSLAERVRADPAARALLAEAGAEELGRRWRAGELPEPLQRALDGFLAAYGHRAVAEIDLGVPRWSEDPTHLLAVLGGYLRRDPVRLGADERFRLARTEAEAMVAELSERAARAGHVRGVLAGFFLRRMRELLGQRELPKETMVRVLARGRELLGPVGVELARSRLLDDPGDIYFVDLAEARAGVAGADLRPLVRDRRAEHAREARRRHVPRLLLSDGTEPAPPGGGPPPPGDTSDHTLSGTGASPGRVTAPARVLVHPTAARLEPGEVLVAPSTDPGWTPLFLTAGGLVMEMGGPMSHGAIVAREYGIPAVVGVADATTRIASGQQITVDGSSGVVGLAPTTAPTTAGAPPP